MHQEENCASESTAESRTLKSPWPFILWLLKANVALRLFVTLLIVRIRIKCHRRGLHIPNGQTVVGHGPSDSNVVKDTGYDVSKLHGRDRLALAPGKMVIFVELEQGLLIAVKRGAVLSISVLSATWIKHHGTSSWPCHVRRSSKWEDCVL